MMPQNEMLPFKLRLFILQLLIIWKARTRLGGCRTRVRRGCPRVGAASERFFFFFPNLCQLGFDSCRTGLIRPATEMAETDWNRPKSTLNLAGTAEILTLEDRTDRFCLLLSLFCESRIVMCFLIIF